MRKSIHVTYHKNDKQWRVCSGMNGSCTGKYATQKEAINAGRKVAMEASAEFVIHGKDGKIRLSQSYGNDPSDSMKYKKRTTTTSKTSRTRRKK